MSQADFRTPLEVIRLFRHPLKPLKSREDRLRGVACVLGLSKTAKTRIDWMLWHEANGKNALKTSRHFGISPKTFHEWHGLYTTRTICGPSKTGPGPRLTGGNAI